MDDVIRRQDAIDAFWKLQVEIRPSAIYAIDEMLKQLPSAQPWIPCSERLPKEMGTYMATIDYGEHGIVSGQRYYYGQNLGWMDDCVIAWMPLPEPWKGA